MKETLSPALYSPFLFHPEYTDLMQYNAIPFWWGHFEFKGFIVAGDSVKLEHGPDPEDYTKTTIFSGHFHLRQSAKNIHYIGNTFPTTYADANDNNRGLGIYDYAKDEMTYVNYEGPSFVKTTLTTLLEDPASLRKFASVKCLADADITLEEAAQLKEQFVSEFQLREFNFEEPSTQEALADTNMDLSGLETETTDSIVTTLLGRIEETKMHPEKLIEIYKNL